MSLWSKWIAPLYQITSRKFGNIILLQFNNETEVREIKTFFPSLGSSFRLNSRKGEGESAARSSCFTKNHYNVVNIYNVYQMMGWTTTDLGSQRGVSIKGFTQTKHAATHWNQLSTLKEETVGKNRFPIATDNNGSPFDIYDLDTNTNNRSGAQVWNRSFTISQ